MYLLVGHLSQDSTFNVFEFLSKFFFSKIQVSKLRVRLICECGLYVGVYGIIFSLTTGNFSDLVNLGLISGTK